MFRIKSYEEKFLRRARRFSPFEVDAYSPLRDYLEEHCALVEQRRLGIKLIAIADTHGALARDGGFAEFMQGIESYDLCLLLGDVNRFDIEKITEIVPPERMAAVLGNHDDPALLKNCGLGNVNGRVFEHEGLRIAAMEGSFRYKQEPFPLMSQYESLSLAMSMLPDADILFTHDRAFAEDSSRDAAHCGLIGETYYIYKNRVPVHLHGHIHSSYRSEYKNGTKEYSIYGCEYLEL